MKNYVVHISESNEDQFLPGPTEDLSHLGCAGHTPCPDGYVAWHGWADRMRKTHRPVRCPECGLFKIAVPKKVQ